MSDKKFELGDYVEVKDRIAIFYELYANGRLVTDDVVMLTAPDGKQRVMVKALAYRTPDDPHPAVGYSWLELPGKTPYTNGSEVENAETSAWGRAIAALGILIDRSIASRQEVDNKTENGDGPLTSREDPGGVIGTVITQGSQDYELRQTPDGPALPFRIKDGKSSVICVAEGSLAEAMLTLKPTILGQRVQAWGTYSDESFGKGEKRITYRLFHVVRLQTPDGTLPALSVVPSEEAESIPAFTADDLAAAGIP